PANQVTNRRALALWYQVRLLAVRHGHKQLLTAVGRRVTKRNAHKNRSSWAKTKTKSNRCERMNAPTRTPMIHFSKLKLASAFLLAGSCCAFLLARSSSGQEQKPPTLPVPEMQRLSRLYAGRWEYTETYPKSGAVNTGVYTSEPGPGGNSIFNRFHSKGPAGEFEGAIVMTWDPREKAYKSYTFGNGFPGTLVATGQWERDVLVSPSA